MSYQHINNLYKEQTILLFKECFCMEKIDGTSSHITFNNGKVSYFSGGEKHENFIKLFDTVKLTEAFIALGNLEVTVYGEAYGGKCQGMKDTYGPSLKFVAFEVKIGDCWLNVTNAEDVCKKLGLEFVYYTRCSTDIKSLDAERDNQSIQAIRNGCGEGKMREGIVIRPIEEFYTSNGSRVIAKHKRDEFMETKTPRQVDPSKLAILTEAKDIADEWVTDIRLQHVLDKIPNHNIEQLGTIIKAMTEDILREGVNEVVDTKEARKAIGGKTAFMYKVLLKKSIEIPV